MGKSSQQLLHSVSLSVWTTTFFLLLHTPYHSLICNPLLNEDLQCQLSLLASLSGCHAVATMTGSQSILVMSHQTGRGIIENIWKIARLLPWLSLSLSLWRAHMQKQPGSAMCLYHSVRGKYPLVQGKSRSASSSTSSWDDYTHGKQGFRLPPTLMHEHTHTHTDASDTQTCTKAVPRFRTRYQASQEPLNYCFE